MNLIVYVMKFTVVIEAKLVEARKFEGNLTSTRLFRKAPKIHFLRSSFASENTKDVGST